MPEEKDYSKAASDEELEDEFDEETTEEEPEETDEDDVKALKEQLEGLTKQLNDTKTAFGQSQTELHQLQGKMEAGEKKEPAEDWLDQVDEEDIRTDPAEVKGIIKQLRQEVADVLVARDQVLSDRLNKELEKRNPEVLERKEQIEELKQDGDYSGFSDEQLAVIAKKHLKQEPKTPKSSGAPGGGRTPPRGKKKTDPRQSPLFKKIYGDMFEEKEKKNAS